MSPRRISKGNQAKILAMASQEKPPSLEQIGKPLGVSASGVCRLLERKGVRKAQTPTLHKGRLPNVFARQFARKAWKHTKASQTEIAGLVGVSPKSIPSLVKGIKRKYPAGTERPTARQLLRQYRKRLVAKAVAYTKAKEEQIAKRTGLKSTRTVGRIAKAQGVKRKYKLKRGSASYRWRRLTSAEKKEIKRLRKEKKLSERKLAKMFGVTQPGINRVLKS